MTPFFSVVIPLYNKEAFIESTLQSVLQQSFDDFEIIIVDDGSTDQSFAKVTNLKHPKVLLFKQQNQGVSVARNFGIEQAKGKYIALLDADDTWYANHLFEQKKQIDTFPNAGLYCNNYEIFHNEHLCKKATFNFSYHTECLIVEDYFKASIINSLAWTSAVSFSKDNFIKLGRFNPNYKTAQDLDLWIRFALNYPVSFNPTITMSYKFYVDESLSKNEFEYNQIRYNFTKSYIKEEFINPSLKLYMDANRYALAIRSKLNGNLKLHKTVKKDIDFSNLNWKQIIILHLPKAVLYFIKRFQKYLISNNIYITAYK